LSVIKHYQFLSKAKIEDSAHDLLMRMQSTPNFPRWPGLAERAADFLKLGVVWCSIPPNEGKPVAARIYPTECLIEINEGIPKLQQDRGFAESTLAHEIGHWMLHVNQDEAQGFVKQLELPLDRLTTEQPFLCRITDEQQIYKITNKTQDDWREWQAQYFASCLLMPQLKLEEVRKGRDLTNWRHLRAMADELGVTQSNLKHRLKDLGWIYILQDSKQIYPGKAIQNGQTRLFGRE
jgi:hypothetical protein